MRLQPVELLADVGLGGEQRRLHVEPALVEPGRARPAAARTCSARRWRDRRRRRATDRLRPAPSAPRCGRDGRRAPRRAPRLPPARLLRGRPAPASSAARMAASRRRARLVAFRSASGTSSTPRSASSPSALAGATPNCSTSRLASPARSFRNASLTTGCAGVPAARPTVSVACTLPREKRFCDQPAVPAARGARSPAAAGAAPRAPCR